MVRAPEAGSGSPAPVAQPGSSHHAGESEPGSPRWCGRSGRRLSGTTLRSRSAGPSRLELNVMMPVMGSQPAPGGGSSDQRAATIFRERCVEGLRGRRRTGAGPGRAVVPHHHRPWFRRSATRPGRHRQGGFGDRRGVAEIAAERSSCLPQELEESPRREEDDRGPASSPSAGSSFAGPQIREDQSGQCAPAMAVP